jgi:hypothetical protein
MLSVFSFNDVKLESRSYVENPILAELKMDYTVGNYLVENFLVSLSGTGESAR